MLTSLSKVVLISTISSFTLAHKTSLLSAGEILSATSNTLTPFSNSLMFPSGNVTFIIVISSFYHGKKIPLPNKKVYQNMLSKSIIQPLKHCI